MPKHRLERIPLRWRIKHYLTHLPTNLRNLYRELDDMADNF